MKKHLYIFSFKIFLIKFVIILLIFFTLQFLIFNEIFKKSEFRLNKVFNGNYKDVENIILGNSRSYSIIFNSKVPKNLNFSYNEMTFENLIQILQAIEKKSLNSNIFIEITSLIDEEYNCSYHIFISHKYFNKEKLKQNCIKEYLLSYYLPFHKLNSELFYRTFFYYFFNKNDQSFISGSNKDKSICENNNYGFYDLTISNVNKLNNIKNKLDVIENQFSNMNIKFFILPYHQASYEFLRSFEVDLNNGYNNRVLLLNQKMNKDFYINCENFLDRIHLSKKGIKEIDFKNKIQ